jgi:hypothetical protein
MSEGLGPYYSIYDMPNNLSAGSSGKGSARRLLGYSAVRNAWDRKLSQAREETNRFASIWWDLAQHFDPEAGYWLRDKDEKSGGMPLDNELVNRRGSEAYENLRAGMSTTITPSTTPWWHLEMYETSLNDNVDVQLWLHTVTQILQSDQQRSNCYTVWQQGHGDIALFGSVVESTTKHADVPFIMHNHPAGTYHVMNGADGRVSAVFEEYRLTTVQMVEQFGIDNVSTKVGELWASSTGLNQKHKIVHVMEPNDGRVEDMRDWRGKPYVSAFYEPGDKEGALLAVEGFWEQPFTCARWSVRGSNALSLGACARVLGHVKQLQETEVDKSRLEEWLGDPALITPSSLTANKSLVGGVGVEPGMRLSVPDGVAGVQVYPAYTPHPNHITALDASIERREAAVARGLFEDVFFAILQLPNMSGRTATEVLEKRQDALQKLAPMVSSQHWERLGPQIDRQFSMRMRSGTLPPAPELILGQPIKVVYTSAIAQAMKAAELRNLDHLLMASQTVAAVDPGAAFKVDGAQFLDAYREGLMLSPELLHSNDEAQQRAEQAAQQQQAAQMAEGAKSVAGAARDASQAQLEGGGSVLDQLIEQAGGAQ